MAGNRTNISAGLREYGGRRVKSRTDAAVNKALGKGKKKKVKANGKKPTRARPLTEAEIWLQKYGN